MSKSELSPRILRAISETMTWCSHSQVSGKPFLSPELDPLAILDIPNFSHGLESIEAWIDRKRDCYCRAISWINETRSQLLKAANIATLEAVDALSISKLLIYEPLETVDDGAAEVVSTGFYDLHDAPPWDTWFLYANHAVFCCVPESAIPRAQMELMRIQLIASTGPTGLGWLESRNKDSFESQRNKRRKSGLNVEVV